MNRIILASMSPRRKSLLSKFNAKLHVKGSFIEEYMDKDMSPEVNAMSLAFQKAEDVSKRVSKNDIIIAADTLVYKGRILGKPQDRREAYNMLKYLSGSVHSVFTGIAVMKTGSNIKVVDYEETKVEFRQLKDTLIEKYLDTGEYIDKAGSYGIQGKGAIFVKGIKGSYSNVVGLPIAKVDNILSEYFDIMLL
ncbi:nucleoside triphosphate pyrophosphatase [Clostridiisalibacter paucivorans]|uniref:nucleoside triphosphate pyrophosphatase n=1 Tax=Clostridiisalibacter paucivorans TaxID=408753 RepID=UPI000479620E|nr:Maf family protein [Clostridiisalibacter paucivorans]